MKATKIDNGLNLLKRNAAYIAAEFRRDRDADELKMQLLQLHRDVRALLNDVEELK